MAIDKGNSSSWQDSGLGVNSSDSCWVIFRRSCSI